MQSSSGFSQSYPEHFLASFGTLCAKEKHSAAFVVRKIGQTYATKSSVWLLVDKAHDALFTGVTSKK
jgi:hypothetical protein